jgi:amino acid transporter
LLTGPRSVWSFAATGLVIGIYAGGMPVLIWGALLVGIVLSLLVTSFAEFGSAYPSVAGCLVQATKLGGPEYGRICVRFADTKTFLLLTNHFRVS